MFPWLDRIFGAHYLPDAWPERYGIDEAIQNSFSGQSIQPLAPQPSPGQGRKGRWILIRIKAAPETQRPRSPKQGFRAFGLCRCRAARMHRLASMTKLRRP
jgi:hypothetical protein